MLDAAFPSKFGVAGLKNNMAENKLFTFINVKTAYDKDRF